MRWLLRAVTGSATVSVLATVVLATASFLAGLQAIAWLTVVLTVGVPVLLRGGRHWWAAVAWMSWTCGAYAWVFDLNRISGVFLLLLLPAPSLLALLLSRFRVLLLWANFFVFALLAVVDAAWVSPGVVVAPLWPAVTAKFGVVGVELLLASGALLAGWFSVRRPDQGFWSRRWFARMGVLAAAGACLSVIPGPSSATFVAEGDGVRVGFVQTIGRGASELIFGGEDLGDALGMLLARREPLDIVVLPESVTSSSLLPGSPERASVEGVSRRLGGAVLAVGVSDEVLERNSVRYVSSTVDLGRYDKVNLVPGSERRFSWLPGFDNWTEFSQGSGPVVVVGERFRAGALICYDIGDASMVRSYARAGVDMLVLSSSTGRLPDQVGYQQLLVARVRALESGVPVVLASRGGPSALVGADGSIVESLDRRASGVVSAVFVPSPRPPYQPLVPSLLAFGVGLVLLVQSLRRQVD